ncbi:MAG: exodeoxyribonuclease VII large subunit [Candidatus Saccharimonadales bacterium]
MEKLQNNQPVFGVSDFIAVFNQTIEYAYPSVTIEGEVASFKVNQNKYVFFDIKDAGGSIGCFMSVYQLRMPIEDGMKVIVTATPKLTAWGKFSLTIKTIRPSGEGAIKKSFEILKAKLNQEGLFSPERKRSLPAIPKYVAVISSTQAAGYADFIKIVNDRWGGLKIDVGHVQVQGDVAADQIIQSINYFNSKEDLPEVIVIIRGGGSADDLAVFNDERLVRAIASSRVPTLVGVGHETDESLADLVADVRAATPSNAAQILVPDKNEIIRSVHRQVESLLPRVNLAINQCQQNIRIMLGTAVGKMESAIDDKIRNLKYMQNIVAQLDPSLVLARGYALLKGSVKVGEMIEVETSKILIKAEVKNVQSK